MIHLFPIFAIFGFIYTSCATQWAGEKVPYKKGDIVPVTCLNRTIDSGEHVTDSAGNLQYIPFPVCAETARPLAFTYLSSRPQNCTITLTDELFHLFEFYIHNDSPLTCRLPVLRHARGTAKSPVSAAAAASAAAAGSGTTVQDTEAGDYVPLVIGLAGQLQKSHLHVANQLNVVIHTSSPAAGTVLETRKTNKAKGRMVGALDSASGYSVSPLTKNTRIVIGDALTFEFAVQWFEGVALGGGSGRVGGGGVFMPMLFGAVFGFGVCWALGRGMRLPKSLERMLGSRQEVLPKYNGYGYGVGSSGGTGSGSIRKGD